ncbi:MAG: nickel pincer cofactor biosynthesis protein LarC [Gammaproteobacteria bacterium]|nr:nickel pincer cofactor biosynthesis protein LarC [Gammaproteobacteria bacterium]
MKILHYDCFSGISGDMHLGAMIDIGVDKEYLLSELKKLNLTGYNIQILRDSKKGIQGSRVNIELTEKQTARDLKDIEKIIFDSRLSDAVKQLSSKIFQKLAAAEAKIHGKSIHEIHFHEVGAVDAILDIVGSAICIDALHVEKILCSPVELGGGYISCEHGTLPVPAPATIALLKNVPIRTGKVAFETTTPTGAAILATIVDEFGKQFEFTPEKTGYGIGMRDLEIPNVLRVTLGSQQTTSLASETITVIECNIDDMNPEFYDYLIDKLMTIGAKDVYITPIYMKKTRPAAKLTVLCSEDTSDKMTELLLNETTTLGIRTYRADRAMLEREISVVETKYGKVKVKSARLGDKILKSKPEYEDCKRIANEMNVPLQAVYDEVNKILLG